MLAHSVVDLGLHGDVHIAFLAARALTCSLCVPCSHGPIEAFKLSSEPFAAATGVGEVHAGRPDELLTHGVLLKAREAGPRETGHQLGRCNLRCAEMLDDCVDVTLQVWGPLGSEQECCCSVPLDLGTLLL